MREVERILLRIERKLDKLAQLLAEELYGEDYEVHLLAPEEEEGEEGETEAELLPLSDIFKRWVI